VAVGLSGSGWQLPWSFLVHWWSWCTEDRVLGIVGKCLSGHCLTRKRQSRGCGTAVLELPRARRSGADSESVTQDSELDLMIQVRFLVRRSNLKPNWRHWTWTSVHWTWTIRFEGPEAARSPGPAGVPGSRRPGPGGARARIMSTVAQWEADWHWEPGAALSAMPRATPRQYSSWVRLWSAQRKGPAKPTQPNLPGQRMGAAVTHGLHWASLASLTANPATAARPTARKDTSDTMARSVHCSCEADGEACYSGEARRRRGWLPWQRGGRRQGRFTTAAAAKPGRRRGQLQQQGRRRGRLHWLSGEADG